MKSSLKIGLLIGITIAWGLGLALVREIARQSQPHFDASLLQSPWANFMVPEVGSPSDAKARQLFWMTFRSRTHGAALDVLNCPDLFRAVFPGYPESMARDATLWKNYFAKSFEPNVVLSEFRDSGPHGHSLYIANYEGCLEIVKRYGGDLLLLGNSIMFRHLVVDQLAALLPKRKEGHPQRVLMCTGDLGPEGLEAVVEQMQQVIRKEKVRGLVLAMSPGWATDTFRSESVSEKAPMPVPSALEKLRHQYRLKNRFPNSTWRKLFPVQWDDMREKNYRLLPATAASVSEKELWQMLAQTSSEKCEMEVPEQACSVAEFKRWSKRVVAKMRRVTQNIFIFRGPASEFYLNQGPACFSPAISRAIESLRGPGVNVYAGTWREKGLTDHDFLYWTEDPQALLFDWNHANAAFARKVTGEVAKELAPIF